MVDHDPPEAGDQALVREREVKRGLEENLSQILAIQGSMAQGSVDQGSVAQGKVAQGTVVQRSVNRDVESQEKNSEVYVETGSEMQVQSVKNLRVSDLGLEMGEKLVRNGLFEQGSQSLVDQPIGQAAQGHKV